MSTIQPFLGDFDMLPLGAHIRFGVVPTHTTSDEFQLVISKCGNLIRLVAGMTLEKPSRTRSRLLTR